MHSPQWNRGDEVVFRDETDLRMLRAMKTKPDTGDERRNKNCSLTVALGGCRERASMSKSKSKLK